jgi:hypothetical protein
MGVPENLEQQTDKQTKKKTIKKKKEKKKRKEKAYAKGSLSIGGILKGVKDFFQRYSFASFAIHCFPHDAIGLYVFGRTMRIMEGSPGKQQENKKNKPKKKK